jgi:hypothetical protein
VDAFDDLTERCEVDRAEAFSFLVQRRDQHLMHLGALGYDPLRAIVGLRRAGRLAALALVVEQAGALPDPRPTVMVAADDQQALAALLAGGPWPERSVWAADAALCLDLERVLGSRRNSLRGLAFYGAEQPEDGRRLAIAPPPPTLDQVSVRQLSDADATLDLSPCMLSPTALLGWMRHGWRVFGAVRGGALLAHALAAYPIGDSDEVAAVYTAGQARRAGLGAAVVAATIADIHARGRRAFYVASRGNLPSRRLAERIGLRPIGETGEIVADR